MSPELPEGGDTQPIESDQEKPQLHRTPNVAV